jgi:hypothetical protein
MLKGMTRERKTHVATVAVLVLALGAALAQKNGWRLGRPGSNPPSTPQDAIYGMLDAARSGNVAAYLASYTGAMLASLQESVRETTEAAFSGYLRDSNRAIKGVAVIDPQITSNREATARVEYVYQDRNEVQILHLEKVEGDWKIARVEGAERVKTLVPYGTPVR